MIAKGDDDRGGGDEFPRDQPPPTPTASSAKTNNNSNDDDDVVPPPPREMQPTAVSTTTTRPMTSSNDDNFVDGAPDSRSRQDRVLAEHKSAPFPKTIEPMAKDDNDRAPLPPEMMAASFEVEPSKAGFIDDDAALPLEWHVDEEVTRGEMDDDDDDEAPVPPELIAAYFEGDDQEEEKREEGGDDDDEAPRPPEMIAASYEAINIFDHNAKKKSLELTEDGDKYPQVPEEQITPSHEAEEIIRSVTQDIGRFYEIDNDEPLATMKGQEGLNGPSLSSNQRHYTAINVQDETFSVTPTHQGGNDASLATSGQGHMEMPISTTEELISPPRLFVDPNNQSLPLLEATLVQDVPNEPVYIYINTNSREDEPVYDAFPLSDTQNNDWPRWLRKTYKMVISGLDLVATAAKKTYIMVTTGLVLMATAGKKNYKIVVFGFVVSAAMFFLGLYGTTGRNETVMVFSKHGFMIVGDGEYDELGSSVALSKNASTMVVGATGHNVYTGYVSVYHKVDDGGNWTRLGQTINGHGTGDSFGQSVDITADGSTIICGSPGSNAKDRPGYVRVFKLESNGDIGTDAWRQVGQDITGEANGDEFGYSVSISDDGETIAIGAHYNNGIYGEDSGHVRIYQLDDDGRNWEQIGDDIDGDAIGDEFGSSVSLSANGTILVIGAPWAGVNEMWTGGVKVFRINSAESSNEQLGESIYGDNEYDMFGSSVDISYNGDTIAIGSSQSGNQGPGYVRVFHLEGSDNSGNTNNRTQLGQDMTGEAIGDEFGCSVSLSDDGKTIAISAHYANEFTGDDSGRVRVFRMSGSESEWLLLGEDIDGEESCDRSGSSVAASGDGNTVAIGSPYYYENNMAWVGRVRVVIVE